MNQLIPFFFGHEQAVLPTGASGSTCVRALSSSLSSLFCSPRLYYVYVRPSLRMKKGTTVILVALRAALLTLMIVLLLRPVVVVSSEIPRSSYVPLLIDDSLSMKLEDTPDRVSRRL